MTGQDTDAADPGKPSRMRRRPVQRRSRERVRQILDATAAILEERGRTGLSTAAIAERAGVSVGSIYQFFPNVDAIVTELGRGWLEGLRQIMTAVVADGPVPIEHAVDRAVDGYVRFFRERPGFRAVYFGGGLRDDPRGGDGPSSAVLTEVLVRIWERSYRLPRSARLETVARVAVQIGDAMLDLAFRTHPHGDASIIAETKRALGGYVADALSELGYHPPR